MARKFKGIVFLDRDGTINEEKNVVRVLRDLEIYPYAAQAIKLINLAGYAVVIASNQPGVAKGFCTEDDVKKVNNELVKTLASRGARVDAVFYCPHHPQKGFAGENPAYKIDCECRKPKTGMFKAARKLFKIGFSQCFAVGDQTRDILAGKNIGCKTILVKTGFGGTDNKFDVVPDFVFDDLLQASEFIAKCGECDKSGKRSKSGKSSKR